MVAASIFNHFHRFFQILPDFSRFFQIFFRFVSDSDEDSWDAFFGGFIGIIRDSEEDSLGFMGFFGIFWDFLGIFLGF